MAEDSTKADQIRKLREIRMLAVKRSLRPIVKRDRESLLSRRNPKPIHEQRDCTRTQKFPDRRWTAFVRPAETPELADPHATV